MPAPVVLRPVTAHHRQACLDLQVRPEQRAFVAPNAASLSEASAHPAAEALAVYRDDEVVGFVLLHPIDPDRPHAGHAIVRLMIDQRFQGQGLGRSALAAAVEHIVAVHRVETVRLSVVPENGPARRLYAAAGFVETGEIDDGEIVMELTVS